MPPRWPDAGMTASSTRRCGWAAAAGTEFDGMVASLASALGGCAGLAALACGGVLVVRRLTVAAPAPSGAVLAVAAAGLADRCEVQLAYAIGVSEPVSVHVETDGTGKIDDERLCSLIREVFPLSPRGIIDHLDLRRPIYRRTAFGGHFGRDEFPWEKTDKAEALAAAAK